jgi:hypothetical protein
MFPIIGVSVHFRGFEGSSIKKIKKKRKKMKTDENPEKWRSAVITNSRV